MRVLVTGGHGFVGSHLVEQLLERGDEVRVLYRRPGQPAALAGLEVEIARGDVRDPAPVTAALQGVHTVFHLAALTRSRTRREMMETNVRGTATLLAAAAETGLPGRFVLCSSLAAVGPAEDGVPIQPDATRRPLTWYGESKARAEDLVLAAAGELAVSVLRPPAVYGPRDADFLTLFRSVRGGFVPVIGGLDRRYSLIHGADLASALLAIADAEATRGGTYFAAHEAVVTQGEMLLAVEAAVGRTALRLQLPGSLMRLIGSVTDLGSQLTGRPSLLGSQRMRELVKAHWVCSPSALTRDTGWRAQLDLQQGFAETARWYVEAGKFQAVSAPRA